VPKKSKRRGRKRSKEEIEKQIKKQIKHGLARDKVAGFMICNPHCPFFGDCEKQRDGEECYYEKRTFELKFEEYLNAIDEEFRDLQPIRDAVERAVMFFIHAKRAEMLLVFSPIHSSSDDSKTHAYITYLMQADSKFRKWLESLNLTLKAKKGARGVKVEDLARIWLEKGAKK